MRKWPRKARPGPESHRRRWQGGLFLHEGSILLCPCSRFRSLCSDLARGASGQSGSNLTFTSCFSQQGQEGRHKAWAGQRGRHSPGPAPFQQLAAGGCLPPPCQSGTTLATCSQTGLPWEGSQQETGSGHRVKAGTSKHQGAQPHHGPQLPAVPYWALRAHPTPCHFPEPG